MTLAEIEAELDRLNLDDLRRVALISWMKFVGKEGRDGGVNECDEDDPQLLAALDQAIALADMSPMKGHLADEVRAYLIRASRSSALPKN